MVCKDDKTTAQTLAVMTQKVPQRGFREALAEVKKAGRPLSLDIAEGAFDEIGGATALGKLMATDLQRMRGDHLPEELKQFHDPDYKDIKGMYEALIRLAVERDKMVGDVGDPLDGVSEDDLMIIASQAAMLRIEVDAAFRDELLSAIVKIDPEAVLRSAEEALDIVVDGPKVELIIDGQPA